MEEFRRLHGQAWPTSFSGRMLWEDTVGRLYQVAAPGKVFLIDPSGRLMGEFADIAALKNQLARALQSASAM